MGCVKGYVYAATIMQTLDHQRRDERWYSRSRLFTRIERQFTG